MNELSKYLVEQILLEESTLIKKTIVVYVGRFQPFHKGHYSTYEHLVKKFGKDSVYVGTSNKTEKPKSPFNFKEKKEIMTTMFGIPSNKIVEVKNPYAPVEILKKFDEKTTAFVTVVGEKDMSRLGGKYFEKWNDSPSEGYKDRGYVYVAPAQSNAVSGTDVRIGLGNGSDEQKKNFFIDRAYPKFNKTIFNLITNKLNESVISEDAIEDEKYTHIGYGKYKLKGQEDDKTAPSFEKDDSGKYIQLKSNEPSAQPQQTQAGAIQGADMFKHAPDVQKKLAQKQTKPAETNWKQNKDGWEILDDARAKVKTIRDYTDEEYQGETSEYFDNDVTKNVAPNAFKDESDMIQKMKAAKPIYLSSEDMQNMNNTDVGEILSASVDGGQKAMIAMGKKLAYNYGKDWNRLEKGIQKGNDVPPPIALRDKNGDLHLVAGNTRLMSFTAYGKKLPVKIIDYNGEFNKEAEPKGGGANLAKYSIKNLKRKISGWAEKEKEFFKKEQDRPDSETRRTIAETLRDKVKGARNAIVHGLKHEAHLFKTAGKGVANFVSGKTVSDEEKTALVDVGKKIVTTAVFGIATGGLSHGILPFAQHLAVEFVPHIVAETLVMGAGRAALFADTNEEERLLMLFADKLADGLESMPIPADVMEKAIDSYNTKQGISEMSKSQLNQIEKYAEKQLSPEDIEFSNHFFDRVNDPRNGKEISEPELTGFFKRLSRHKKQFKEFLEKYQQIVVKDKRDDINIAFVKQTNQIIAKTVMRKSDFKSSNPILSVESDNIPGGLAKGMSLNDIAKKHNVSLNDLIDEFKKGYKVEREHTTDINIAKEIALDHLFEDPKYYTKLSITEASVMGISFENDGNSTTGYYWNKDWDDYDDQDYYLDNLDGWSTVYEKPSEFEKKRTTDQAIPIDNHSDGKTSKYNRILKYDYKEPAEFLKTANVKEEIKLDIKVGDEVLMGKFKNKKVVVKSIGTDEHGMPTINGKKAVTFRYIKENINESKLLVEGGAYGHMNHPFDTDINLTFGQLKNIVNLALEGELELAREKTDGQALAISWVGGRLVAARNKSHLKNKGAGALDIKGVADKFSGRGELEKAYNFAMQDLTSAIKSLSEAQRNKIFKDGSCFMNLEVIYPTSVNVIPYGQPLLVFHGTMEYDMDGNAIGENQQAAKILAGMIKQINQDVQSNYTIQGPPVLSLPKSQKLSAQKAKYLGKIQSLQKEFGLSDTDGVANYHQAWWENFVTKKSPSMIDNNIKMGLVKRWAFGDKGFRIDNKSITDEKVLQWAQKIDKEDQSKISKDNLMKFEDIFLGVGAEVLQFTSSVLTVNPDSAVREMKKRLDQTIKDVQKSGDPKKIEKLKLELKRLTSIGGPNKIVPIEGIVFVYGGKTFKLTGAFASLNQLLGIFYS